VVVVVNKDLMAHNVAFIVINVPLDHQDFAKAAKESLVSNAGAEASSPTSRYSLGEWEVCHLVLTNKPFVSVQHKGSKAIVTAAQ